MYQLITSASAACAASAPPPPMAMMGAGVEQGWGFIKPPGAFVVNTPALQRSLWTIHPQENPPVIDGDPPFPFNELFFYNPAPLESGVWFASDPNLGLGWDIELTYSHSDARAPGQTDPTGIRHYYEITLAELCHGVPQPATQPCFFGTTLDYFVIIYEDDAYRIEQDTLVNFATGDPFPNDEFEIQVHGTRQPTALGEPIYVPEPSVASGTALLVMALVAGCRMRRS